MKLTNKEPSLHVYELSRLVHAPAADWERKLEEIREGRDKAYGYYHPVREAIVRYCKLGGKHRNQIVSQLVEEARRVSHGRGQSPERDNLNAFEVFEASCYPKISTFVRSFLREPRGGGILFEGLRLIGGPHIEVTDRDGRRRFVFLHASSWKDEELKAYLELLSVVLEGRSGRADLLWMNLRTGKTSKYVPRLRLRQRCARAAQHFCRLAPGLVG